MAPKVAAADAGSTATSPNPKAKTMDDAEYKLVWSIISQMSAGGKLVGVDWEQVSADVGASTKHAAYLRWDKFKARMKARGLELPTDRAAPEKKAKVAKPKATATKRTPKKKAASEAAEEAVQASRATSEATTIRLDQVEQNDEEAEDEDEDES